MEEVQKEARSSADLTMIQQKHRDSMTGSSHPRGTVAEAVAAAATAAVVVAAVAAASASAVAHMTAAEPVLAPDHHSFHLCLRNT